MNNAFLSYINNKSVGLLGLGISNAPLVSKLLSWGASRVTVRDKKSKDEILMRFPFLSEMKGIEFICGDDYLKGIDEELILKTPGIRYDVPELLKASENGTQISSEIELFFRFCPAYKIAVTGSDGKTTTTSLIYEMLKAEGKKVFLGGNIGEPLLYRINDIEREDVVVAELSSFQLHTQKQSPDVAVITNISPNHLDWHKDFEEYKDAKASIMKYQTESGVAVLNGANEGSLEYKKHVKGTLRTFSGKSEPEAEGAYLKDGAIFYKDRRGDEMIVSVSDIKIPGSHNVENYMAAICATRDLVKTQTVKKVATSFTGVKHRLQLVRIKDGVRFYNSSIDSSPSRTTAALSSFKEKNVIVILGGKDKKVPFDSLSKPLSEKCKCAVLTGMAMEKIYEDVSTTKEFMEGKIRFYKEPDFEAAVKLAAGLAESGDAVLLSPACTSFDRFLNFEQRGEFFTDIVNSL